MAVRGQTIEIALNATEEKSVDDIEQILPITAELRNGVLSDAGNFVRVPGYKKAFYVGVDVPCRALLPIGDNGYAIMGNGDIYDLRPAPVRLTARMEGSLRPKFVTQNGVNIVVDGGRPIKIKGDSSVLAGNPPLAKYVARIGDYTVMAGHDEFNFQWCDATDPETWTATSYTKTKREAGRIRGMAVYKEILFILKSEAIEAWAVGGDIIPFSRMEGAWILKGVGADDSIVSCIGGIFWLGNDYSFYRATADGAKGISFSHRKEIGRIPTRNKCVAYHAENEGKIKWFFPEYDRCFTYDYKRDVFSQGKSLWQSGAWQPFPVSGYMEFNGEAYFGDSGCTGSIYHVSDSYRTFHGSGIRYYRRMRINLGDRKMRINRLKFRVKRGSPVNTGEDLSA